MSGGRGVRGNREVSPVFLLRGGGGGRIAGIAEATPKEGGSWGKHGFPDGSEPKARDGHEDVTTIEMRSAGAGFGAIGSLIVRKPRSYVAVACSGSTSSASVTWRWNGPYSISSCWYWPGSLGRCRSPAMSSAFGEATTFTWLGSTPGSSTTTVSEG